MDYEQIVYEVRDRIVTVTLSRPDQLNAFTERMRYELLDVFDRIDADDEVRAVIVTGAGRAFCAGADLSRGGDTFVRGGSSESTPAGIPRDGGGMVALRIFQCLKPVIAAINGPAVGVGITMTLPMDVRLAATGSRIGFVFSRRGIVPEACSSWFLPRLVGISRAAEWCYSGRVFDADEALAGGLVRSVHAPAQLLDAAHSLAQEFAEHTAPVSVALTRQMLWRMMAAPHPMAAHRADSRGILLRGRSADVAEGVTSFLDKREARFPDRVSDGLPDLFPDWDEPEFA